MTSTLSCWDSQRRTLISTSPQCVETNQPLVSDFSTFPPTHSHHPSHIIFPSIVSGLYCSHWERGNKGFAPRTLTELYTGFVHTLLHQHLEDHLRHKQRDWLIKELIDLPANQRADLEEQFEEVIKLASERKVKRQYVPDETPRETFSLMLRGGSVRREDISVTRTVPERNGWYCRSRTFPNRAMVAVCFPKPFSCIADAYHPPPFPRSWLCAIVSESFSAAGSLEMATGTWSDKEALKLITVRGENESKPYWGLPEETRQSPLPGHNNYF